ncbi:malate synthase [Alkalimonas sp.]|uniref:malate synthase n=1 Tax=Alkalimonas sp. TaxID=1872453 RepID=UPI00263A5892|nr:malate synthase [Alkalimonas sp.]MCC5826332.1 malate synthase [Alkalimonas sp.]
MNTMTQATTNRDVQPLIQQEISQINQLNEQHVQQVMAYSKGLLDKLFPLTEGSHRDVCQYEVYYQHLLAYFADGRKAGLQQPGQFVALCGRKSAPDAIVLEHDGRHVEISLGHCEHSDSAGINDIQIELPEQHTWFSLVHGRQFAATSKQFTAPDGEDYRID